jgi:transposase-like protein
MRGRAKLIHEPARNTYKVCPTCSKTKAEQVGLTAGDGQRWYCSERCLERGERVHHYHGR